jgi:LysM repeat protein
MASHKDAATEDKLGKLTGQIGNLVAAQEAQQRRVDELAKGLGGLREQLAKPDACYASQQDLKYLADAILSVDQKRSSDDRQIQAELVNLGKMLTMPPPPKEVTPVAMTAGPAPEQPLAPDRTHEYVIQAGDTLSSISRAYREKNIKVSVEQILKANPGLKPEKLRLGQKILIPAPR